MHIDVDNSVETPGFFHIRRQNVETVDNFPTFPTGFPHPPTGRSFGKHALFPYSSDMYSTFPRLYDYDYLNPTTRLRKLFGVETCVPLP